MNYEEDDTDCCDSIIYVFFLHIRYNIFMLFSSATKKAVLFMLARVAFALKSKGENQMWGKIYVNQTECNLGTHRQQNVV